MSINITNLGGVVNYNDNHKEININTPNNVTDIIRACQNEGIVAEDVEPDTSSTFPYLTPKCIKEKRTEAVEAEIRAACKGTAEALWRTLWNNENLGYVEVEYIDATTIYRAIEKWYGKLPYKERNFRDARNKR